MENSGQTSAEFNNNCHLLGRIKRLLFAAGVLTLSAESIKVISSSAWGSGEQVAVELAQQKVDFQFGSGLLCLSFILQLVAKLPVLGGEMIFQSFGLSALVGCGISAIVVLTLRVLNIRSRKSAEVTARAFNQ